MGIFASKVDEVAEAQKVCKAGKKADCFYVVASGVFDLTSPKINDGKTSLGTVRKGGLIAEHVLYGGGAVGRLLYSVTCVEPGTLFALKKSTFLTISGHVYEAAGVAQDAAEFVASLPACAGVPDEAAAALVADARSRQRSAGDIIAGPDAQAEPGAVAAAGASASSEQVLQASQAAAASTPAADAAAC